MDTETPSYRVQLDLDGASLGNRTATIEITDSDRNPVDAEHVVVSALMSEMDMTGPSVVAEEIEPGRFEAKGELFTMLGEWNLAVRVEGGSAEPDEQAMFTVEAVP
jgi:YtkA-like